jgi:hypothetical protein
LHEGLVVAEVGPVEGREGGGSDEWLDLGGVVGGVGRVRDDGRGAIVVMTAAAGDAEERSKSKSSAGGAEIDFEGHSVAVLDDAEEI